jgi:hypothetical protein
MKPRISEGKLTKPVKGDALHEAGRDDAIGVDVIAGDENAATGDLGDFFKSHGKKSKR